MRTIDMHLMSGRTPTVTRPDDGAPEALVAVLLTDRTDPWTLDSHLLSLLRHWGTTDNGGPEDGPETAIHALHLLPQSDWDRITGGAAVGEPIGDPARVKGALDALYGPPMDAPLVEGVVLHSARADHLAGHGSLVGVGPAEGEPAWESLGDLVGALEVGPPAPTAVVRLLTGHGWSERLVWMGPQVGNQSPMGLLAQLLEDALMECAMTGEPAGVVGSLVGDPRGVLFLTDVRALRVPGWVAAEG